MTGVSVEDASRLPAGSLDVRATSAGMQFLLTDFSDRDTDAHLRATFPGAAIHIGRPALREAFVAHARSLRTTTGIRGAA